MLKKKKKSCVKGMLLIKAELVKNMLAATYSWQTAILHNSPSQHQDLPFIRGKH